jgi:uncharacterized protein YdcH (DUF465 family)
MATQRLPTEPSSQPSYRLGVAAHLSSLSRKRRRTLMENTQEDLKAHLMQTDEGFRRLAEQHSQYHQQLEALEAKAHLTPQEEVEEHRLKKLKLHLKDQMNQVMSRYRAQHVA